jgi:hypothetical protein
VVVPKEARHLGLQLEQSGIVQCAMSPLLCGMINLTGGRRGACL